MKRLKKGFTLIELLVVIAIIGILATTLAPKLREQLAKAKDAKAVALLGSARTIVSTLAIDKMVQATGSAIGAITGAEVSDRFDKKSREIYTTSGAIVLVGGTRGSATGKLAYAGTGVILSSLDTGTANPISAGISVTDDGADIYLKGTAAGTSFSSEGKEWITY